MRIVLFITLSAYSYHFARGTSFVRSLFPTCCTKFSIYKAYMASNSLCKYRKCCRIRTLERQREMKEQFFLTRILSPRPKGEKNPLCSGCFFCFLKKYLTCIYLNTRHPEKNEMISDKISKYCSH